MTYYYFLIILSNILPISLPTRLNEFLQDLVEYLHTNVATVFQEIQITAEEYALLKTILVFSGGNNLSSKQNIGLR